MESGKLKNIVLTILIVTNLLLAALMVYQRMESRHLRRQTLLDAVTLLAEQGIAVDPDDLPRADFPTPRTVERDAALELERFTRLLGEGTALTQRGAVAYYTGPRGRAEVRSDGAFSVVLTPGAYPRFDQTEQPTQPLMLLGFDALERGESDTESMSYYQSVDGLPVFTCTATLSYDDLGLCAITGTRLVGTPDPDHALGTPLSTATLLIRFHAGLIESGDTCTAIVSAAQGYTLAADDGGTLRLTPVLKLETDTNLYYLNAVTGELRRR